MSGFSIMGIDPGGTTGVAWCDAVVLESVLDDRVGNIVGHEQLDASDLAEVYGMDGYVAVVDRILMRIRKENVRAIAIETFQLVPGAMLKGGKTGKSPLDAVVVTSMLKFALTKKWYQCEVVMQSASQGKGTMNDTRLRALSLWWPGEPHARDAARHLMTLVKRAKANPKLIGGSDNVR